MLGSGKSRMWQLQEAVLCTFEAPVSTGCTLMQHAYTEQIVKILEVIHRKEHPDSDQE